MNFGPKNYDEAVIFKMEELRADVQYDILRCLKQSGLSQAQLARKMGVSAAWVSQLLSDEANLTLESIAKVYHALGRECAFTSQSSASEKKGSGEQRGSAVEHKAVMDAMFWMVEEVQTERSESAAKGSSTTDLLMRVIASQRTSIRAVETCNDNGAYVPSKRREFA